MAAYAEGTKGKLPKTEDDDEYPAKEFEELLQLLEQSLLEKLFDAKNKILIQEWHKEKATQEKVRWEIQQILGHHLPEPGYNRLVFSQKVDVTFQHFYGLAQMGLGFVA